MTSLLKQSKDANPNYLATICKIGETSPIENADRLVKTVVNGYDIIISKDYKPGDIVVYFPVETSICEKYLSANNQYERGEFERNANAEEVKNLIEKAENADEDRAAEYAAQIKSMCGFFNKNGRVRILKLRGQYSQGFIAGIDSLVKYNSELAKEDWNELIGTQFNFVGDEEFCWKYIPPVKEVHSGGGNQSFWKKRMKHLNRFDRIIAGQFTFHYDTKMLAEHIKELSPDDIVTITVKVHGTSVIIANVLCNRKLSIFEKVKKFLGFKVVEKEYGNVYSSRSVIKNQYINPDAQSFYNSDIWGCVNRDFSKFLTQGMTVYGEIAGYLENSDKLIQPNHDYGCTRGHWKFMPYRITETDIDGNKKEWDVDKVYEWAKNLALEHPEVAEKLMPINILYYGKLGDLYPDLDTTQHWHENLLVRMKNDKDKFLMELDEPLCRNKVPREGIVIRKVGDETARAWKLKTLRHYGKEAEAHDKDITDIEETA